MYKGVFIINFEDMCEAYMLLQYQRPRDENKHMSSKTPLITMTLGLMLLESQFDISDI